MDTEQSESFLETPWLCELYPNSPIQPKPWTQPRCWEAAPSSILTPMPEIGIQNLGMYLPGPLHTVHRHLLEGPHVMRTWGPQAGVCGRLDVLFPQDLPDRDKRAQTWASPSLSSTIHGRGKGLPGPMAQLPTAFPTLRCFHSRNPRECGVWWPPSQVESDPCLPLPCIQLWVLSRQDVPRRWRCPTLILVPSPHPKSWDALIHSPVSPARSLVNLYCYIASPVCHVS